MKSQTKKKTIHYKRAQITGTHSTLQHLITEALKDGSVAHKALHRRELLNQNDESCRLLNTHQDYSGMFFGQLVFFESGRSQALITIDEDAESYSIDSITPDSLSSKKGGKKDSKKEFVDSILYFGVFGDHLVVMQSAALKSRELEVHLAWLLSTCTKLLEPSAALILQDKPTKEALKKIETQPVKSVHLGTPVATQTETLPVDNAQPREQSSVHESEEGFAKNVKWIPVGKGADVIRAALGADWFNNLELEESLDEANLQVNLEITYMRKTTRNGQRMLDNIATSLRHQEESDVKVDLHGGGTLKGTDIKLSGPINVKTNNGMIDESDLFHQMHNWLVSKINSADVDSDEQIEE